MSVYDGLTETQQFACRVIADHARATAFSIADGILPGNEGRNYVLRKIMRRAIYHGREHLGFKDLFFYKVCDFVINEMHEAYPELETQREFIGKMVRLEEERFGNTMTVGLSKLNELDTSTSDLFTAIAKLYDTYGTPRDLIRVYLEEKGSVFEEDEFNEKFDATLQELQKQSGIGRTERKSQISPVYAEVLEKVGTNRFHGYDTTRSDGTKVLAILDGDKQIAELKEGEQASIILADTPFYAESGGQVGDTGYLVGVRDLSVPPAIAGGLRQATDKLEVAVDHPAIDLRATVSDTYSPIGGLIIHKVKVDKGSVKVGDAVDAIVDREKRDATRRNHTATHLVHAALREVLGTHVKQAGSVVAPNYLRFDFTHYQPLTGAEIVEVEDLVNRYILENHPVNTNVMAIEEAMREGAMALFGEKYGADVRVLSVGDGVFSKELCGGTHVRATGDIGSFKLISDEAIASGVRRIRAITGFDAFERFREDEKLIDRSLGALKTQRDNLPNAIERLQEELKRTRKEIDDLKLKIATGAIGGASSNGDEARDVSGVKVLGKIVDGLDANGTRQLSDTLLARLKSGVVVLGRKDEDKVSIIVRVSNDLTDKIKAGNVIKEIVPIVGGRGGGKPDMAEGGGSEPEKLSEAIDASYGVIERMLQ
ncbi:MAG TPA: alanine--tRNA ligase [Pyrinomonadaceae bacterium]|nr:alanine--tRNA ligase [Pyrinomonadaceae bacterium]